VTGGWKSFITCTITKYSMNDQVNEDVPRMGRRGMHIGFFLRGKPEGKKPLGKPRHMRVDNINGFYRGRMGCCGLD
jgi:hypothetical protein